MSLVRISAPLLEEVGNSIDDIAANDYRITVAPLGPHAMEGVEDTLYTLAVASAWGEHAHLRSVVPADWLKSVARVDIKINGHAQFKDEIRVSRKTELPPKYPVGYESADVRVNFVDTPADIQDKINAFTVARAAHKEKYKQVRDQVLSFLRACKSLNDAMTRFPDIGLYIPQSYKDKVAEKVDRKAREAKAEMKMPTINTDLIVSAGVMGMLRST